MFTANAGDDYVVPPQSVMAVATAQSPSDVCFDVDIIDDNVAEVEECFEVTISLPSPSTDDLAISIVDDSASSLCCIVDNDSTVHLIKLRFIFELFFGFIDVDNTIHCRSCHWI